MKTLTLVSTIVLVAISGCATQKDWSAAGGSKSDGTVRLSYQMGLFESPKVSEQQAISLATKRCSVWGYSSAEAFGAEVKSCNNQASNGCNSWLITKEYQCID